MARQSDADLIRAIGGVVGQVGGLLKPTQAELQSQRITSQETQASLNREYNATQAEVARDFAREQTNVRFVDNQIAKVYDDLTFAQNERIKRGIEVDNMGELSAGLNEYTSQLMKNEENAISYRQNHLSELISLKQESNNATARYNSIDNNLKALFDETDLDNDTILDEAELTAFDKKYDAEGENADYTANELSYIRSQFANKGDAYLANQLKLDTATTNAKSSAINAEILEETKQDKIDLVKLGLSTAQDKAKKDILDRAEAKGGKISVKQANDLAWYGKGSLGLGLVSNDAKWNDGARRLNNNTNDTVGKLPKGASVEQYQDSYRDLVKLEFKENNVAIEDEALETMFSESLISLPDATPVQAEFLSRIVEQYNNNVSYSNGTIGDTAIFDRARDAGDDTPVPDPDESVSAKDYEASYNQWLNLKSAYDFTSDVKTKAGLEKNDTFKALKAIYGGFTGEENRAKVAELKQAEANTAKAKAEESATNSNIEFILETSTKPSLSKKPIDFGPYNQAIADTKAQDKLKAEKDANKKSKNKIDALVKSGKLITPMQAKAKEVDKWREAHRDNTQLSTAKSAKAYISELVKSGKLVSPSNDDRTDKQVAEYIESLIVDERLKTPIRTKADAFKFIASLVKDGRLISTDRAASNYVLQLIDNGILSKAKAEESATNNQAKAEDELGEILNSNAPVNEEFDAEIIKEFKKPKEKPLTKQQVERNARNAQYQKDVKEKKRIEDAKPDIPYVSKFKHEKTETDEERAALIEKELEFLDKNRPKNSRRAYRALHYELNTLLKPKIKVQEDIKAADIKIKEIDKELKLFSSLEDISSNANPIKFLNEIKSKMKSNETSELSAKIDVYIGILKANGTSPRNLETIMASVNYDLRNYNNEIYNVMIKNFEEFKAENK